VVTSRYVLLRGSQRPLTLRNDDQGRRETKLIARNTTIRPQGAEGLLDGRGQTAVGRDPRPEAQSEREASKTSRWGKFRSRWASRRRREASVRVEVAFDMTRTAS